MSQLNKKNSIKLKKGFKKGIFSVLMLSLFLLVSQASAAEITSDGVVNLVNKARNEAGVPLLVKNESLQKAAIEKANDMFEQNYFAHTSPSGKTPWDFIEKTGYDYQLAGENLAIDYEDLKEQQSAWMNSPLHRKNILNPAFQEIGVAVKKGKIDGHETIITVQEFGTRVIKVEPTSDIVQSATQTRSEKVSGAVKQATPSIIIPSAINKIKDTELNSSIFNNFVNINEIPILAWIFAVIILLLVVFLDVLAFINKRRKEQAFMQ